MYYTVFQSIYAAPNTILMEAQSYVRAEYWNILKILISSVL